MVIEPVEITEKMHFFYLIDTVVLFSSKNSKICGKKITLKTLKFTILFSQSYFFYIIFFEVKK